MPGSEWRLRFDDIVAAIDRVSSYIGGYDLQRFTRERRTIDAVLYCIQVVGEAANHVPPEIVERFPDLPRTEMRGMRNILIHEYFGIDVGVVWATATQDLPALRTMIVSALSALDKSA